MKGVFKPRRAVANDYFELVARFPLVPIRNDRMAAQAAKIIERLAPIDEAKLTPGQADYLQVLARLADEYDRARHPVEPSNLDAIDHLRQLMTDAGMTASDLGRLLGNRSLGGKLLRRERELSKSHILTLAQHFGVGPGLFLKVRPRPAEGTR